VRQLNFVLQCADGPFLENRLWIRKKIPNSWKKPGSDSSELARSADKFGWSSACVRMRIIPVEPATIASLSRALIALIPRHPKCRKGAGCEVIRERCRKYSAPISVKLKAHAEADEERGDE
jgi:hypothetical protein